MWGNLKMIANNEQSFDVSISASIPILNLSSGNQIDLKDPEYRGVYENSYYNPANTGTGSNYNYW